MSESPNQSPISPLPAQPKSAISSVRAPARSLIIVSTISIVVTTALIASEVYLAVTDPSKVLEGAHSGQWTRFALRLLLGVSPIGGQVLILSGGLCMLRLKKYRLAQASALLSVLPTCSPCMLLGIPFGIWAWIVLARPDVRSAFD